MEKARRIGLRDWDRQLTHVVGRLMVLQTGDFDWYLDQGHVYEGSDVPSTYRSSNTGLLAVVAALRDRPDEARALIADATTMGRDVSDRQALYAITLDTALVDAVSGRPAEAHDRVMTIAPEAAGTWLVKIGTEAGQFALLVRDPARLAAARGVLDGLRAGPSGDALLAAVDSALAALGGEVVTARRGFVDAADMLRAQRLRFELAWILLGTVAQLETDDPVGSAAADEARALFEAMGAPAMTALLDGIESRARRVDAKPSARPAPVESPAAQA
jgi:hypothetical protein